MEFLINESQLALIIKENKKSENFSDSIKEMISFTTKMVDVVSRNYKLNIKMLLTWGTSVAGLMMPLNEFIKSGNFEISESERYLVLCGVSFLLLFEGSRNPTKILDKIKKEGLEEYFKIVYEKGIQLRESFFDFIRSLKIISSQFLEIISYCFLIPIIGDIQNLASSSSNLKQTAILIAERLIASGGILLSREILVAALKKILSRIRH